MELHANQCEDNMHLYSGNDTDSDFDDFGDEASEQSDAYDDNTDDDDNVNSSHDGSGVESDGDEFDFNTMVARHNEMMMQWYHMCNERAITEANAWEERLREQKREAKNARRRTRDRERRAIAKAARPEKLAGVALKVNDIVYSFSFPSYGGTRYMVVRQCTRFKNTYKFRGIDVDDLDRPKHEQKWSPWFVCGDRARVSWYRADGGSLVYGDYLKLRALSTSNSLSRATYFNKFLNVRTHSNGEAQMSVDEYAARRGRLESLICASVHVGNGHVCLRPATEKRMYSGHYLCYQSVATQGGVEEYARSNMTVEDVNLAQLWHRWYTEGGDHGSASIDEKPKMTVEDLKQYMRFMYGV